LFNAIAGAGIYAVYNNTFTTFDIVLSGLGQGNQGGFIFTTYTINCAFPVGNPNICTTGQVFGPAVNVNPGPDGINEFVSTTPLPDLLIQLAAVLNSNKTVTLTWSTAQEVNSDYFEVERSTDQVNWTVLGEVKAKGNSDVVNKYTYVDAYPPPGIVYYRLKMVDLDGKFQLSKIVHVSLSGSTVPLVIYNNPFVDEINVKVNVSMADNLTLSLTDMTGRTILRTTYNALPGDNLITIVPTSATAGVYILSIQGNTYSQAAKLVRTQ
jgi:Secretion system C-terminal sorting domain